MNSGRNNNITGELSVNNVDRLYANNNVTMPSRFLISDNGTHPFDNEQETDIREITMTSGIVISFHFNPMLNATSNGTAVGMMIGKSYFAEADNNHINGQGVATTKAKSAYDDLQNDVKACTFLFLLGVTTLLYKAILSIIIATNAVSKSWRLYNYLEGIGASSIKQVTNYIKTIDMVGTNEHCKQQQTKCQKEQTTP